MDTSPRSVHLVSRSAEVPIPWPTPSPETSRGGGKGLGRDRQPWPQTTASPHSDGDLAASFPQPLAPEGFLRALSKLSGGHKHAHPRANVNCSRLDGKNWKDPHPGPARPPVSHQPPSSRASPQPPGSRSERSCNSFPFTQGTAFAKASATWGCLLQQSQVIDV